jgi:hypothetical protein
MRPLTKYTLLVLYIVTLFLIIGEAYFRLPTTLPMLSYEFDADFGHRFKPNQSGVSILGKGVFTPVITLNSEGFRGKENNGKKAILCLGSSEVLGTGVKDNETWNSVLEQSLLSKGVDLQVINAGQTSHGPSHFRITLGKYLSNHPAPEAVIIRVATGDMDFFLASPEKIKFEKINISRKEKIKKFTLFIPYLLNKIDLQKSSIQRVFNFHKNKTNNILNKYESIEAADTMINRFKPDFISIISTCQKENITLIFCIIDPMSAPSNVRLSNILDSLTLSTGYNKAHVCPIFSKEYNLQNYDLPERKKIVMEKLRLPGDPHSNVLQHSLIGAFLSDYYITKIKQ